MSQLTPMRSGEELDIVRLESYLRNAIPDLPGAPLQIWQFAAGRSNLTYLLSLGGQDYVLRRPPLGPVPPKAHDMVREYEWLVGIYPVFPWAPKPIALCTDASVLGSTFFLMEHRPGVLLEETLEPGGYTPTLGERISKILVERMVDLHAVDWKRTGLESRVKPEGFLRRQVEGWIGRYQRAKIADIAGDQELTQWLLNHVPPSPPPTIIHYDYKLNNMVFDPDYHDVAGIFDWEMSTVGDPIADVAVAMSYWIQDNDDERMKNALHEKITILPGFWSRDRWISEYARLSGRDLTHFSYYLTFAYFKLAVIVAQIYYRYHRGQTQDPRFADMNQVVEWLVDYALSTRPHLRQI
ncbi:MAG: phosphotransferase family protein [Sulfobacillus benefaciens]|uniref:Phosphotransferase family protein n=1 Tax=Sulfobacillus benefaciens TaxID=453960 RepID=A0A2T2XKL3_9FIRM|nr:MAG: phosphotransferase family protein [Sulfobacillus benefaciens]